MHLFVATRSPPINTHNIFIIHSCIDFCLRHSCTDDSSTRPLLPLVLSINWIHCIYHTNVLNKHRYSSVRLEKFVIQGTSVPTSAHPPPWQHCPLPSFQTSTWTPCRLCSKECCILRRPEYVCGTWIFYVLWPDSRSVARWLGWCEENFVFVDSLCFTGAEVSSAALVTTGKVTPKHFRLLETA